MTSRIAGWIAFAASGRFRVIVAIPRSTVCSTVVPSGPTGVETAGAGALGVGVAALGVAAASDTPGDAVPAEAAGTVVALPGAGALIGPAVAVRRVLMP
ncbi:hypothetical protein [Frankia tisae]|uniref:hypothetical protein n=1 Tax=Frankia tisae TaxID=2950104 RepID=UPI0021C25020|nr:hypothetical protein [Frankia tisae]